MVSKFGYQDELASLHVKIARLEREDHGNLVVILRYEIGDVEGLDG